MRRTIFLAMFLMLGAVTAHAAPHSGTMNSICIFIRFADQSEFDTPRAHHDSMFNLMGFSANSVRRYYDAASYGDLNISTTFYPECELSTNESYQDIYDRGHYQPWHPDDNPDGYTNEVTKKLRERDLLSRAVMAMEPEIPYGLDIDGDDDGFVDNVSFIIRGGSDSWGDLLWPHRSWHVDAFVLVNGKFVLDYTFQPETDGFGSPLDVGTLCHETGHVLGSNDLYDYDDPSPVDPVEHWDLMASDTEPPQHMSIYTKRRHMQWGSTPEITNNGSYTLNPVSSPTNHGYRIPMQDPLTLEYYVLEFRRQSADIFEAELPGSGLVVYRIDGALEAVGAGNGFGPPYEAYVYRMNGTPTVNGLPDSAHLGDHVGRVYMNDYTNPSGFQEDGEFGGLFLADISDPGFTINFYAAVDYVQLPGSVYNGGAGTGPWGPAAAEVYWGRQSHSVPSGSSLTVESGARVYLEPGKKLTASGTVNFQSGVSWTRFFGLANYRGGIKSKGDIRLMNGGCIKFPSS